MLITNGVWVPAGAGRWHHFTVTRDRAPDREDVVRVAYELTDGDDTPIEAFEPRQPDADADRVAEWHLGTEARDAWRAQRAAERATEEPPDRSETSWRDRIRATADEPRDTCDEDYL